MKNRPHTMSTTFDLDASERLLAHCVGIISAPDITVGQLTAAADDLVAECGTLLAEVKRLGAETEQLQRALAAEQGKPEGAPSSDWQWNPDMEMWSCAAGVVRRTRPYGWCFYGVSRRSMKIGPAGSSAWVIMAAVNKEFTP